MYTVRLCSWPLKTVAWCTVHAPSSDRVGTLGDYSIDVMGEHVWWLDWNIGNLVRFEKHILYHRPVWPVITLGSSSFSPLFPVSNEGPEWVASVSAICSPLRGCFWDWIRPQNELFFLVFAFGLYHMRSKLIWVLGSRGVIILVGNFSVFHIGGNRWWCASIHLEA